MTNLLHALNQPQHQAVTADPGHLLVLAGAGSGKTRVLTHRIAWLIMQAHVSPFSILAVTFTNKAAFEMRGRIESLLNMPLSNMWVGTFHGLSHRLLRAHYKEVNLPQSFQILDADDQYRLIRRIHKNLELPEDKWQPKQSQWYINQQKEEGRRPGQVPDYGDSYFLETVNKVYHQYEEVCRRSGLVDFAELLLRSLELLQQNDSIREHYQQRFQHILVDEFQDTNSIQYAWLRMLAGEHNFVMAVGDDDQSIYSWRGAKIENLHRFSKDFHPAKTIRLEQNYRSTQNILDAANAVIDNNTNRLGKKLWTDSKRGEPISLYAAFNERDESYYIATMIDSWLNRGRKPSEIAILYRSNAQSRVLEERLIDRQIPYRIYGGLKFFERAEIKDALAYLRLIANRHDDAAFERVVNTPTRGIGNNTLISLRTTARENAGSLWKTAQDLIANNLLPGRAANALQHFLSLIDDIDKNTKNNTLAEQTEYALQQSGLIEHYKKEKSEKGLSRVENLEELVNATSQFRVAEEEILPPLAAFLSHVALETGEEQADAYTDCVSLMTLHSAKGLEFPFVILCGMEEELFPHRMSLDEPHGLEEERRLCYVGMTRAMEKLLLTYAESRYLHGLEKITQPSRFIYEIPTELVDSVRPTPTIMRSTPSITKPQFKTPTVTGAIENTGLCVGQRVKHAKFGRGIIINYEGSGEHARLQVKFDEHGAKWLVASYAKLVAT
jgi:DNA helicase-2/ATP-dependent DNA helicase PcrA